MRTNQLRLLCQAAVDGVGVAMQPTFSVWKHLAAGRLKTILDGWSAGAIGVFVVYPSRSFLPAKTRLFIDFVAERFHNDPDRDVWIDRARTRPASATRGKGAARERKSPAQRPPSARRR